MEKSLSKSYIKSNKHETVKLSRFAIKYGQMVLNSKEDEKDRQERSQKLMDYLCKKFDIAPVNVMVTELKRPSKERGQLFGFYLPSHHKIVIYNTTAKTCKPTAIKTFFDTLIHEFMHHYDYQVLKLEDSFHTTGFYKRIDDLKKKLI